MCVPEADVQSPPDPWEAHGKKVSLLNDTKTNPFAFTSEKESLTLVQMDACRCCTTACLDHCPTIMHFNGRLKVNNEPIAMHLIPHVDNVRGM